MTCMDCHGDGCWICDYTGTDPIPDEERVVPAGQLSIFGEGRP